MAAPQATPGIKFTVGNSRGEAQAFTGDLRGIRDMLKSIQQEAKATSASLNDVLGRAKQSRGTGAGAGQQTTAPSGQPRQAGTRRQASPAANADRNIFAGMTGNAGMSDAEWREVGRKQQKRREDALKAGMELSPTERREYARTRAVNASLRAGRGAEAQGLLARGMSALSWSPFMPQSMYYGQMALEALGLPLGLVAGGMGVAGLGAAGLALNAYATEQARTGNQLVSATGAPPFTPNTYVTGAAEANLLTQRTGARGLNLPDKEGQQAVSALAAGGLSSSDAFGRSLDETAALINAFGMSVQDAAGMVTTWRTDMRMSDDQVTQALQSLGQTALATGMPLSALGQIVEQTPNMLADLAGDPSQYGPVAALQRGYAGTTQGALQLNNLAFASGTQALSLASQMGLTDQQFNALQASGAPGVKKIDDFVVSLIQQAMQQSGGAVDQAMLMVNGRLGTNFSKAQLLRLNSLTKTTTDAAFQAALQAPGAPGGTGSADAFIKALAAGNPAAAALLANPPNIKDVTLNAAQVFLTGAVNQVGTTLGVATNADSYDVATLRKIAAQGGIAGFAATAALVGRGVTTTPMAAATAAPPTHPVPLGTTAGNLAQQPLTAPGGGGGGGQPHVLILDLRTDGVRVAQLPVNIGPNQQYAQYVPVRYHAPGRGPQ